MRVVPRLPNAQLRRLLLAWFATYAAGWAMTIALAVYAYVRSGVGAVGVVAAARLLPAAVAAPVLGGLLDRSDRRLVVAGACLAQAACLAGAAAVMGQHGALWLVTALAALSSAAATAPRPGLQALLPALAGDPEELTAATAAWSAADSGGFLVGSGAGGIAIAVIGTGGLVAAAAACAAIAAALSIRLRAVAATPPDTDEEPAGGLADVVAGVRTIVGTRLLRVPFALFAGLLLLEGTTDVQLVALALRKLALGEGGPGLLFGVWGIGGLLASAAILVIVRRRGYGLALGLGAVVFALALALAGIDGTPVAIAAMIPAGIGFALVEVAVTAIVPRLADDAVIGRVYAVSEALYAGAAALGALLAPALIAGLGVTGSLIAVGAAYGAGGVAAWGVCRALDADQEQAGRVRTLLHGIPFLGSLPLARLERLVRAARPVDVTAGELILRAGDPGEEFFVIEHGTVAIEEHGRRQGAGTGFGEIALLRDVPRTATVRAIDDVKLWAVTRPAFIGAVTGHSDAQRIADSVVAEHLNRPRVSSEATART